MSLSLLRSDDSDLLSEAEFGAEDQEAFAAFVDDDETRELVGQLAADQGWRSAAIEKGGAADCVRTFGVLPPPRILLVDLSSSADAIVDMAALKNLVGANTAVIAIGSVNDVSLFRGLIGAGAADYLVKPLAAEALLGSIEHAKLPPAPEPVEVHEGRLMFVIGARGGVGASTVALNSAWVMAHELEQRVALVDLDLQFGTLALGLDLEPGSGLREALERPDRVDELFIERALARQSERLFVLGSEDPLDKPAVFPTQGLVHLLEDLVGRFDRIVVDLPRALTVQCADVLSSAHDIILVSDLSLVGLRDAVRLKRLIAGVAPGAKVTIVASRAGRADQLSLADFERGLETKIEHTVFFEEKIAGKSANVGQPIVKIARRSRPATAIHRLCVALCDGGKAKDTRGKKKKKTK